MDSEARHALEGVFMAGVDAHNQRDLDAFLALPCAAVGIG
jgi:hypothetical protein